MTVRKEFSAARKEQQGTPIEFGLGGETFSVQTPLPGILLLDLTEKVSQYEGKEDTPEANTAVMGSFGNLLSEALGEDYGRFKKATAREGFDLTEILDIAQWIIREASGRPTEQLPPSQELSSDNSPTSGEAA